MPIDGYLDLEARNGGLENKDPAIGPNILNIVLLVVAILFKPLSHLLLNDNIRWHMLAVGQQFGCLQALAVQNACATGSSPLIALHFAAVIVWLLNRLQQLIVSVPVYVAFLLHISLQRIEVLMRLCRYLHKILHFSLLSIWRSSLSTHFIHNLNRTFNLLCWLQIN